MALIEINRTVETPSLIRDPQGSEKYLDPRHLIMAQLYGALDRDSKTYKMEVERFKTTRADFDSYSEYELFFVICEMLADEIFDERRIYNKHKALQKGGDV